ncbi:hypothetical protein BC939DRAFT_104457 [Gamsiella multidivaricata]|uniref:uncharacterized protein n=1 Tax=Gamsiella multidivaricata TaxID=101098 RepID=UPI00221F4477|nr:uncharacterized protein BC939DRAFT_104457 [Gamsiella multidivaricata]KAI7832457.1 hypothetical protein BC939DRAFT_104457 [Gamsiella multidivaricata]
MMENGDGATKGDKESGGARTAFGVQLSSQWSCSFDFHWWKKRLAGTGQGFLYWKLHIAICACRPVCHYSPLLRHLYRRTLHLYTSAFLHCEPPTLLRLLGFFLCLVFSLYFTLSFPFFGPMLLLIRFSLGLPLPLVLMGSCRS